MANAPRIPLVSEEDVSDDIKAMFDEAKEAFGLLPDSFKMMANQPETFKAFWQYMKTVNTPKHIDAKTKIMMAIAIFATTNCQYGVNAQTKRLRRLGVEDEEITELFMDIAFWNGLSKWNSAAGLDILPGIVGGLQ